jgi:hypothetical protein
MCLHKLFYHIFNKGLLQKLGCKNLGMQTRMRLTASNNKAIARATDPGGIADRRKFAAQMTRVRKYSVERWYKEGGYWFLSWVKEHYRTWTGELLRWEDPFSEEFYLIWGNPWIVSIYAEKSAQVGFSEGGIAFTAFCLGALRVPTAYGVEQERKLGDMVGPRIQPALDNIAPIQKLKVDYKKSVGRKDTDTKQRQITVGGVLLTCFYASTSSGGKGGDGRGRQAASGLSSFTAWVLACLDEIELWPSGALDVARQRQEASPLPTKPLRAGSTPGHEGGIVDTYSRGAKYLFQWEVRCPCCDRLQHLDPFGNLLIAVPVDEEGNEVAESSETEFIDIMGRPRRWFHREPERPIETAFVGCLHCGGELSKEAIAQGRFTCINSGISLRELHDKLLKEQVPLYDDVSLRLPKLATARFSAPERIRRLIQTRNPADEIQQGLGKPVSIGGGRINLTRTLWCVGRPYPVQAAQWEEYIVIGVDQGTVGNWVVVCKFWVPDDGEDDEDRWYRAFGEVVSYQHLGGGFAAIHKLAQLYEADLVGIDNEPEVEKAGEYARQHPPDYDNEGYAVLLFDQLKLNGPKYKQSVKDVQGVDVPIIALHRTAQLDAVRDRIHQLQYRFPKDTIYDPKDDENFLYHLQTSERLKTGQWTEPQGTPDHYHHALGFAEMALLYWLVEAPEPMVFGTMKRD